MISALHLIWIIPLCCSIGFCLAAFLHAASDAPDSDSVKTHLMDEVRKGTRGGL